MKANLRILAQQCQEEQSQLERLDPFATAMLMGFTEAGTLIARGTPLAEYTTDGWVGALWLRDPHDAAVGQKLIVTSACRTRKIALITANYFRLHHLINQVDNLNIQDS